jgi:MoaA/NifB/PqqE/SkfB family radical SAM enzyme
MGSGTVPSLRAYAGLGARILGTRLGSTRPFKVTWMVTDRCDCRCEGCFIWKRAKRPEPTPGEIGRVLREAPSLRWVNLTGGEPFLRDDMVAVAAAVREALPHLAVVDFPTTGQRTDVIVDGVRRMAGLGIPKIYVTCSVEGPPPVHDALRGRPGAFANVARTYAALRVIPGVDVYLGMTLSSRNAGLVEETLAAVEAFAPGVGWKDLHLNVYTRSGHYYANADGQLEAPAALDAVVARALESRRHSWHPADRIESAYLRLLPEYLATGRSPLPCRSLRAGVFIDAGGDVFPCTVYGRRLGNVHEAGLYAILDGSEARATRAVIARDACPGCWSPCEAHPTIVATAPESLVRRPRHGAPRR